MLTFASIKCCSRPTVQRQVRKKCYFTHLLSAFTKNSSWSTFSFIPVYRSYQNFPCNWGCAFSLWGYSNSIDVWILANSIWLVLNLLKIGLLYLIGIDPLIKQLNFIDVFIECKCYGLSGYKFALQHNWNHRFYLEYQTGNSWKCYIGC